MAYMHIAEMAVPVIEQNALPFIPDRAFRKSTSGPPESRKCLKAIKVRLTLFLQPNPGFGESFCGSGTRRPQF
jgi:hypothetical protein